MSNEPIWVNNSAQLVDATSQWHGCVALDTEFIRTDTFFPLPGLYQVACAGRVYLLDPLEIEDWECFIQVLSDPSICKVMHACQEDLELIHHHLGTGVNNLFDTQLANAFVSEDYSLSYAALVEQILGVALPKHATRSNWLQRPLSAEQIEYAVEDVIYLEPLFDRLTQKLDGRRSWFEEDMHARGRYTAVASEDYYQNIKKAWQLDSLQLSVLQALCAWREDIAKSTDVPRNRVVWDDHLYQFSRISQLYESDVQEALPRGVARKFASGLCAAHEKGLQARPPQALPRPLSAKQNAMVKSLRDIGRSEATELVLAPELLSRKKAVEACVRHFVDEGLLSVAYQGWRFDLLGEEFQGLLSQGLDIRIGDQP